MQVQKGNQARDLSKPGNQLETELTQLGETSTPIQLEIELTQLHWPTAQVSFQPSKRLRGDKILNEKGAGNTIPVHERWH